MNVLHPCLRKLGDGRFKVSRDITEIIDDHCEEEFGHKDWVIVSTLSDQEKVGLDSVAVFKTYQGVQVAFYCEEGE